MNRIQLAVVCVVIGALQYQILVLQERLSNYMHPPATVNAADWRGCVSSSCVTYTNVGGAIVAACSDGVHSWAPRDGVCYAADAPKVPNRADSSVYYSVQ